MPRSGERRVAILAYPGVQSLDVTGPLEVFHAASRVVREASLPAPGYDVSVIAPTEGPLRTSSGMEITPQPLPAASGPALDTLIVAGGEGHRAAAADPELLEWIVRASGRARRTASVCTGAFVLAAAGLLDGRRATTHWASARELALAHPLIDVDPDPIFVRDGAIWTSAGVTAGMDLALALVEEDLGRDPALLIARHLVLFLRRPGNQSQFSAALSARTPAREPLREVQRAVLDDVGAEHTVEAMAARANMSPRHFARAFAAETGVTPARFVERARLEAARRLLEDTAEPVAEVASTSGFASAETMRRAFTRVLGVGPAEYRRRFQPHPHTTHDEGNRAVTWT